MNQQVVNDLPEFIGHTEIFDLLWGFTVFRGQAVRQNLIPSIARADPTVDTTLRERDVLRQLRLLGASLIPQVASSDLDTLVLAQHFGMKTRLLDWTSNPLAALWFACADPTPGDTYVYTLSTDHLMSDDIYSIDPFGISETKVFQPRLNNPRLIAQHGWFTLHRYSPRSRKFVSLEANATTRSGLSEIQIPAKSRLSVLRSLDRHGISSRTLFPDLAGLCQYLNWKHTDA